MLQPKKLPWQPLPRAGGENERSTHAAAVPEVRETNESGRTIPPIGGPPELFAFYCGTCREAKTIARGKEH
jgi:hypothetical protein